MGWSSQANVPTNVKAFLDAECGKALILSAMPRRNEYYAACLALGQVFAVVILVERQDGLFRWKVMDETEGPYAFNCPKKILSLLSPPLTEASARWREQQAVHTKNRMALQDGDRVQFATPLSFGAMGTEQTFVVVKTGRQVRFRMEKNGVLCRIVRWRERPFTRL